MTVTLFYGGKLGKGKTANDVISYVKRIAEQNNYRNEKAEGEFKFRIPWDVKYEPDSVLVHKLTNKERILEYAKDAKIPVQNKSHEELCDILNSMVFKQVGIHVWVFDKAESLKFLFVEGDDELTKLKQGWIGSLRYVNFRRDYLDTKTGYHYSKEAHEKAYELLCDVSDLFFDGQIKITEPYGSLEELRKKRI